MKKNVKKRTWIVALLLSLSALAAGGYLAYKEQFDFKMEGSGWEENEEEEDEEAAARYGRLTGADRQLNGWFLSRGYPNPNGLNGKYEQAWEQHQALAQRTRQLIGRIRSGVGQNSRQRNGQMPGVEGRSWNQGQEQLAGITGGVYGTGGFGNWSMIGPKVFGGRMLVMAINPVPRSDGKRTIYAGSASGGIWRTYTEGVGANAWEPVPTNLPVLGVSALVYHPADSMVMYAGTGEVYRVETLSNGAASTSQVGNIGRNVWKCRGTYGVGILKSVNGGRTWTRVFAKNPDELFAIQEIAIDPNNTNRVYACATDGLYRSDDAGANWTRIWAATFVNDIAINPANSSQVVVSAGNLTNANKGIWRTADAFATPPVKINSTALPASFKGQVKLDAAGSAVLVAGITNNAANTGTEVYSSADFGITWTAKTSSAFGSSQYWFANDIEINPVTPNQIVMGGVNLFRYLLATSARTSIGNTTATMNSFIGNGGAEGGTSYVHADVHDIEYMPGSGTTFYVACDGGIFRTTNNGTNFTTCNGGLQVQQFYAASAQSQTNARSFIGGLQDNNVIRSNPADITQWARVVGGDGGPTLFMPGNENVVIASRDARAVYQSTNGGSTFAQKLDNLGLSYNADDRTGFMAPVAAGPAGSNLFYVASDNLHTSVDGGGTFNMNTPASMTNPIEATYKTAVALAVSPYNAKKLFVSLSPISQMANDGLNYNPPANVWKTTTGGAPFTKVTGSLPDRFVLDFAISATNDDSVYAALGGFGTPHLYVTGNGGNTWTPIGAALPDAPINTIMFDPVNPKIIYAGSDLGVYVSPDRGINWYDFSNGFWDATYVVDLVPVPGGMIRAVTHGKGIFESDLFTMSVLPVTFTALNGAAMANYNQLTWNVDNESNLRQYEVERSINGISFQVITTMHANNVSGPHTYQYRDLKSPASCYYRIRSVDVDGLVSYSPVIFVNAKNGEQMRVLQNPVQDALWLRVDLDAPGDCSIRLVNNQGQVVQTSRVRMSQGSNYEMLPTGVLPSGVYYAEVQVHRNRWVEKVVRQ